MYEFNKEKFANVCEQKAVTIEEIISEVNEIGREVIFLGDGATSYQKIIEKDMKVSYQYAPIHMARQRAGAIGALGLIYYKQNRIETAEQHQPVYLRLSQAERELAEKQNQDR